MSEYEKQAADFLKATNTEIDIVFSHSGKHWDTDDQVRDIYDVTIKRGNRKMSVSFGNSIQDSGFYYTIGVQKIQIDRKFLLPENAKKLLAHIRLDSRGLFLNNGKSDKIHYPTEPTAYSVLTCLQKYDVGSFENFCGEFGYNIDSRIAEKTYKAVVKEFDDVCKIWTDEEIEKLQEIQ